MRYLPIVANLLMAGVFLLRFSTLPPQIPLFYSRPWGESQLAQWWMIGSVPLLMNFLYFFNKIVRRRFFAQNQFASYFLYYLNVFLVLAFTFVFIKIIFLVT